MRYNEGGWKIEEVGRGKEREEGREGKGRQRKYLRKREKRGNNERKNQVKKMEELENKLANLILMTCIVTNVNLNHTAKDS